MQIAATDGIVDRLRTMFAQAKAEGFTAQQVTVSPTLVRIRSITPEQIRQSRIRQGCSHEVRQENIRWRKQLAARMLEVGCPEIARKYADGLI